MSVLPGQRRPRAAPRSGARPGANRVSGAGFAERCRGGWNARPVDCDAGSARDPGAQRRAAARGAAVTDFPLRYAHGNVLIGQSGERAALYRLDTVSYRFPPRRDKELWFGRLAQLAYSAEADFSLWRVSRAYPVERYLDEAAEWLTSGTSDPEAWRAYAPSHRPRLLELESHLPEIYAAISLATPGTGYATGLLKSADRARRKAERLLGIAGRRPLLDSELAALTAEEERLFARVGGVLPIHRATIRELEWLLRRAALRGIAEPLPERWWQPNALVVSTGEGGRYEPLETDVVRLASAATTEEERGLLVETEIGRSHQALLALGALPEGRPPFPARARSCSPPLSRRSIFPSTPSSTRAGSPTERPSRASAAASSTPTTCTSRKPRAATEPPGPRTRTVASRASCTPTSTPRRGRRSSTRRSRSPSARPARKSSKSESSACARAMERWRSTARLASSGGSTSITSPAPTPARYGTTATSSRSTSSAP